MWIERGHGETDYFLTQALSGHGNVSQPLQSDRQTNIVAEIQAVTIAAMQARKAGIKNLIINTDSKFIIDCFEEHLDKWKAKGWINSRGVQVVNKLDFQKMENALSYLNYEWLHVCSHNGIYGNVMADKLARKGIFA
ncbi:ribonuclease H1-like [Belonocnema kinseyi]|uniref:ribonuclease H1-like n=1 Tax=Belonocnema kinseyi TaxID=2817044 RepID=UPI00143D4FA0|nr:ribonuclease H1-like [Belonocnema kinseyi]